MEKNMDTTGQAIRTFNRFELKYTLTLKQAWQFRTALGAYLQPDVHGGADGRYALTSLYYDSPGLRCYHEKEAGLRFRRKLRIRRYGQGGTLTEETPVFVEIKQRVDRVTQKRRAVLPYREALRLCNDRAEPRHDPQDADLVEEIRAFAWQYDLRPASIVRYERQALVGTRYDPGLRVTFDTSLAFQAHQLWLHEPSATLPLMPAGLVVMEIKVNDRLPQWLAEMIAAHNLQMVRMSKYCRSIDAAQNLPRAAFRDPRRETAGEVLASLPALFHIPQAREAVRRKENPKQ